MKASGTGLAMALLVSALAGGTALARDVYKGSLDPSIPRHQAILDTLSRLEANPKDAGLKNDLGSLIAQEGFWRDALREFDEAAELDPKDGRPCFNAGLVKATRGEWYGARSYFQKATKRDPGNWQAWWMAGFAEEQLGNTSAAVDRYKTSLRVDTSLFDVAVNPFAASSRLKSRVFLETYEARRVKAVLPAIEQLDDPERVASFYQRTKKARAVVAPAPTPEPRTGPVVSAVPQASSAAPRAGDPSAPQWNPQAPTAVRRRGESGQPVPQRPAELQPAAVPVAPPAAPGGEAAGAAGPGPGMPGPGPGMPGPGGGPGLVVIQTPTPVPVPK